MINSSQIRKEMHCGLHPIRVLERVKDIFKNEEDVLRFQAFLETIPHRRELCRADELFAECNRIKCTYCFQRVHRFLSSMMDEGVATSVLGDDPIKAISECTQQENTVIQTPGFLATVYERIDMVPSFVPVGPRYTLEMFLKNMKALLDRSADLRADGRQMDVLETVVDEQNQILGMLADCTAEFVASVYKIEFIRPFQDVHTQVQAFVALFEVLCRSLFDACHKVRKRFHRTDVPSLVGVNTATYLERYKADVPEMQYKGALLSLHILNMQRLGSFRTFYQLACDQVVVLEHEYSQKMSSKFKYVDQMDFALPYKEMPIKLVLVAQLEMALGPLNMKHSTAEFTHGRYPSVVQELGMLELRCAKIQEGHLDCWVRVKDRAVHQLVPDDFPMIPSFRADIDKVLSKMHKANSWLQFTKEAAVSAPRIDALLETDPLNAMWERMDVRAKGLRALTDLVFVTLKVTGLVTFLHDYFPVLQEHVCGTDTHVQLFVRSLVIDAHVRSLAGEFQKYEQERALQDILATSAAERVQTSGKKSASKQKKMSQKKKSEPPAVATAALAATVTAPMHHVREEEFDDDGWEQVQSKKKSSAYNKGTFGVHATNRARRTKTQKTHSAPSYNNTHSTAPTTAAGAGNGSRSRNSVGRVRVKKNPGEPEHDRVEPERVVEPADPEQTGAVGVVAPCEPERSERDLDGCDPSSSGSIETAVGPEPERAPSEVTPENTEKHPEKPKSQRRRGGRRNKPSSVEGETTSGLIGPFGMQMTPIDPLVLTSYAASQVAQPVPLVNQTVAVPARMFGGVLSSDYASVSFMTFPRVYL